MVIRAKPNWARVLLLVATAVAAMHGAARAQEPTAGGKSLETILADIEAEQAKLSRTRESVAAVIAEFGAWPTPTSIHEWVRKNVRVVDYAGSLRDVDGVLADRSGNSLDRSLLLARLLSQIGYDVKIVGADQPSPADKVAAVAAVAVPESERDADEKKARSIADALVKLGNPLKPSVAAAPRHWWVQYNEGNDKWTDLDPALAKPSERVAVPTGRELKVDPRTQQIVVPAELKHRVALVLQVERWDSGKLVETPCLSLAMDDPQRAALVSSRITFQPYDSKRGRVAVRDDADSPRLRKALLSESAWCPVIIDGTTAGRLAKVFDDAGIVGDVPGGMSGAEEMARAVGAGGGGLLGGLGGGGPDESADKPTVLTAVFADYQILSPGAPAKTIRRTVFDTLGPARREAAGKGAINKPKWNDEQRLARGVELNAIHSTLVARAAVDFDSYVARYAQRILDARPLIEADAREKLDDTRASELADRTSFSSLELYATQRSTASDPALYVAEPQIFRRITAMVPGSDGALTLRATSDLAWNPLRTTGDSTTLIEAGVLDTLRESAVIMAAATSPDQSTAALVDEAIKNGATLKLAKAQSDLGEVQIPGDAAARIRADLAAGQWVAMPSAPVVVAGAPRIGWWRIDPRTLQTVGVMDTGSLQNTVEYSVTHEVNGIRITHFYRIRVGPAAHAWAREAIRQRAATSWNQWLNLLSYAQRSINTTGLLPPL
jgi:hypothetical protein